MDGDARVRSRSALIQPFGEIPPGTPEGYPFAGARHRERERRKGAMWHGNDELLACSDPDEKHAVVFWLCFWCSGLPARVGLAPDGVAGELCSVRALGTRWMDSCGKPSGMHEPLQT